MRKTNQLGVVGLLASASLAPCGDAPEDEPSSGSSSEATASDFQALIVSDAGRFDDKSFNQLGFEGATQAADELGVELIDVESNSENDYAPNLESLVAEGCDARVTVGLALWPFESAKANPDIEYILMAPSDGTKDADDIEPYSTRRATPPPTTPRPA